MIKFLVLAFLLASGSTQAHHLVDHSDHHDSPHENHHQHDSCDDKELSKEGHCSSDCSDCHGEDYVIHWPEIKTQANSPFLNHARQFKAWQFLSNIWRPPNPYFPPNS